MVFSVVAYAVWSAQPSDGGLRLTMIFLVAGIALAVGAVVYYRKHACRIILSLRSC
jgi:hypothetical protein